MYAPAGFLETSSRSRPSALISGDLLLLHDLQSKSKSGQLGTTSQFRLPWDSDTGNLAYVINLSFIMDL